MPVSPCVLWRIVCNTPDTFKGESKTHETKWSTQTYMTISGVQAWAKAPVTTKMLNETHNREQETHRESEAKRLAYSSPMHVALCAVKGVTGARGSVNDRVRNYVRNRTRGTFHQALQSLSRPPPQ